MEKIASLHRYWLQADVLKRTFEQAGASDFERLQSMREDTFGEILFYLSPVSVLMSFWYASLYVVVEGYREVCSPDDEIDALLTSHHLDRLRRFRNGVCHYQPEWFPSKIAEIQAEEDHVDWVRLLHRRLGSIILEKMKSSFPVDTRAQIEGWIADALRAENQNHA